MEKATDQISVPLMGLNNSKSKWSVLDPQLLADNPNNYTAALSTWKINHYLTCCQGDCKEKPYNQCWAATEWRPMLKTPFEGVKSSVEEALSP